MDKGNSQLGLNWILKVTNLEAPLNELQVQTHFRSIDNYSRRLEDDTRNAALFLVGVWISCWSRITRMH